MFSLGWHFLYNSLFLLNIFLKLPITFLLQGASFWGDFLHFYIGVHPISTPSTGISADLKGPKRPIFWNSCS
jgi:hypothetical protein